MKIVHKPELKTSIVYILVWRLAEMIEPPCDRHKTVGFGSAWRLVVRMVMPGRVCNDSGFLGSWRLAPSAWHYASPARRSGSGQRQAILLQQHLCFLLLMGVIYNALVMP